MSGVTRILNAKGGAGLCAYLIQVIGFIYDFEDDDIVINMIGDAHYYHDDNVERTKNVWEYFFHQLGDTKGRCVHYDNHFAKIMKPPEYRNACQHRENFITEAHRIFWKYIKVRKEILDIVNDFYKSNMEGFNIISIHKRNSSHYMKNRGHYVDNKDILTVEYYMDFIDKQRENYDKIFLLTDEKEAHDSFKERYKDDLISYNALRSKKGTYIFDDSRGYKYGEDILVDVLLASRTLKLIGGKSNVFTAIRFINGNMVFEQVDKEIR